MKETVGSLKAYFIVVGLLGGIGSVALLIQAQGNAAFIVSGLVSLGLSIGYFYIGVVLRKLLVKSPQLITTVLYISLISLLVNLVLGLSDGFQVNEGFRSAIGLFIVLYLLNNVKRLSAEAIRKQEQMPSDDLLLKKD